MSGTLEHVNFTVSDNDATAAWMCDVFGWKIRWAGKARDGRTVHVGTDDAYLALSTPSSAEKREGPAPGGMGRMNHVGVEVADLDATESRVRAHGFDTFNHADYEPGRRFYFNDGDGIEFEIISYT
ncbi:VOC family protein [Chachezhania antarctica]|uniref:VOC family protein n=1 Tax=Chachezhania antarctica TaxID=2340860 RepID=UPI000EACE7F3|nr:VOC family protein [Chachezhania antarctica]|tara:strand:+ start:1321 stop:1698 length:378 start_codon:yes stop_codon:yes gene_type:complete